jgi:hypothetical protein
MSERPAVGPLHWTVLALVFALLATANAAGYRYGSSDQAFYIPAVVKALQPDAFPRDTPLIDAQGKLILADELIAGVVRATGASFESMFLAAYLVSLAVTWAGLVLIGTALYDSAWLTLALGAAFTMRHRIAETSANTFEPYFHPRMLAFGIGLLAVAALLRRRGWLTIVLVAVAALAHATTAIWFAALLGIALAVMDRRFVPVIVGGGLAAIAFLTWAVAAGPLSQSWVVMDDVWLQAVASKDSLFADQWPLWAWAMNLGLLAVLWWSYRALASTAAATPADRGLVWGATTLVAIFLATLPFVRARWSFFVEFQISRVFWLVDFLATAYVIAALARLKPAAGRALAMLLVAVSVGRAVYVTTIEHPERPLFGTHVAETPWVDAMRWLRQQPLGAHVLADPGHAWKYGTSVRVSAERDVLLEEVKDAALAMYSRDVAVRVVERTRAIGDFNSLTADRARALARTYDLDYLVTTSELPLPQAYRNAEFRIYALK